MYQPEGRRDGVTRARMDQKHRIRRWHPLRPAMMRSLALLDHADQETISRYRNRRLQFLGDKS
jgi:hypothetical protein